MMHLKVMKSIINLWLGCGLLCLKDDPGLFPDFILETQKKVSWMHLFYMFLTGLDRNWETVLAWEQSTSTVNMMGLTLWGAWNNTAQKRRQITWRAKAKSQMQSSWSHKKISWAILSTLLQSVSSVRQLFLSNPFKFWWPPCCLLSEHFFPWLLALLTSLTFNPTNQPPI